MIRRKFKNASVSTEIAVATGLAVVVLFVAIGLFSDNLSHMMVSKKLSNVFNGNSSKTGYSSFYRDYSESQIEVQVTGEQGLEMLRKRANNKALDLIGSPFSPANVNGNSIAYLSKAIEIIVGEGHICSYMKKDSSKPCDEDNIGGYNYKIEPGSTALTIKKVDKTGEIVEELVQVKADSSVTSILSRVSINTSPDSVDEKYQQIANATSQLEDSLASGVALIENTSNYKDNSLKTVKIDIYGLITDLKALMNKLKNSVSTASVKCTGGEVLGVAFPTKDGRCCDSGVWDEFSQCWVGENENWRFQEYADSLSEDFKPNAAPIAAVNNFLRITDKIETINNDHYNEPTSCAILKDGLKDISRKYNIDIKIPTCDPSNDKTGL